MIHLRKWAFAVLIMTAYSIHAQEAGVNRNHTVIHVNAVSGNDSHNGTPAKPVKSIKRAVALAFGTRDEGPVTITVAPGIYSLDKALVVDGAHRFTRSHRLTITASVLPDEPSWVPSMMPVMVSTETPEQPASGHRGTKTVGFLIKTSHVTIRGLKFLGSPASYNRYYAIRRDGLSKDDLVVSQCLFAGDRDFAPIHVAVIAQGHGLKVDHCIFYRCKIGPLFWKAEDGTSRGCSLTHSIMYACYQSGFWTCQPGEDFKFSNNIVAGCEIAHTRERGTRRKYQFRDSVITENKSREMYNKAGTLMTPIDQEIPRTEVNIMKKGTVVLEKDEKEMDYLNKSRNFLHVIAGAFGSNVGAGLFVSRGTGRSIHDTSGTGNP